MAAAKRVEVVPQGNPGEMVPAGGTGARGRRPRGRLAELAEARSSHGVLLPQIKEQMLKNHAEGSEHWSGDALDYMHPSDLARKDWCPRAPYFASERPKPTP